MANNSNAHGTLPQPAPDGATSMAAQSPVVQRIQALGHAPSYYEATIIADEVRAEADRQHEAEQFAQNREAVMSLATMAAGTLKEAMSTIASMSPGRSQAASQTVGRNLASESGSIIAEQDEIPLPPALPSPLQTSPSALKRSAASPPTTSSSNVKRIKKTTGIPPRHPSSATPGKEGKSARKKRAIAKKKPKVSSPVLSAAEEEDFSAFIADNMYKIGEVPGSKRAMVGRSNWDYGHLIESIKSILENNPGCGVFLYQDDEGFSVGDWGGGFGVIYALITPIGETPPTFLHLKSLNGDDPLVPFKEYSLQWVDMKNFLANANHHGGEKVSSMFEGRVKILTYTGRKLRNLSEAEQGHWNRTRLLDARSCKFPEYDERDRVKVESAPYTLKIGKKEFRDTYTKGMNLDYTAQDKSDELKEEGVEADPEAIKDAIKQGFASKRQWIESVNDKILKEHPLVDKIHAAKIYPRNIASLVPVSAKQILQEKQAREQHSPGRVAKGNTALKAAVDGFEFRCNKTALQYGPVQDEGNLFDGRGAKAAATP